ncbi:MAG: sigma-70 family RNA polymerase sigma factor [Gemmatimonadales bacterium]|jgi:RNA polymerase sigma factor (TIGR02999 family)
MSLDEPTLPGDGAPAGNGVSPGDVTRLLEAVRGGERNALDRLLPIVYEELRVVAGRQLGRERPDHTLHATALVHEAYVKLAGGGVDAVDRAHFLAIAARAMRQVLVDHARRRMAAKRGGDWAVTTLSDGHNPVDFRPEEMLALDRALERLEPRQRQVVEYRFFAGMEEAEIAAVLGVSERTVRRDWVKARAWLYRELYPEPGS